MKLRTAIDNAVVGTILTEGQKNELVKVVRDWQSSHVKDIRDWVATVINGASHEMDDARGDDKVRLEAQIQVLEGLLEWVDGEKN
jgi:hypothetical protein